MLDPALEIRQRAVVVHHEVGAGALQLGGHLCRDHLHCFRLAQVAIFDETLEAYGAIRVDEDDAVEAVGHVSLEEQGDVAHHDAVAAFARLFDQLGAKALDLRMDDLVKFFELLLIGENDPAQRGAVEVSIGCHNGRTPATHDLIVGGGSQLDGAARENVGVDDRGAALREHLGDGRFTAADVARESNEEHSGFLGCLMSSGPQGPRYGPAHGQSTIMPGSLRVTTSAEVVESGSANEEFKQIIRRQLELIGEDPDREGLRRTPQRVASSLAWLTRGYEMDVQHVVGNGVFNAEGATNMVMVRDIELYSLCEHHMLPFYGRAHVAYIPNGKIVGLSKLPRIVEVFARRLQVQERLTEQIAGAIDEVLSPQGVGVVIEAYHLCMMMRGVEKQNSKTITSAVRGLFRSDPRTREEFLTLAYTSRAV